MSLAYQLWRGGERERENYVYMLNSIVVLTNTEMPNVCNMAELNPNFDLVTLFSVLLLKLFKRVWLFLMESTLVLQGHFGFNLNSLFPLNPLRSQIQLATLWVFNPKPQSNPKPHEYAS